MMERRFARRVPTNLPPVHPPPPSSPSSSQSTQTGHNGIPSRLCVCSSVTASTPAFTSRRAGVRDADYVRLGPNQKNSALGPLSNDLPLSASYRSITEMVRSGDYALWLGPQCPSRESMNGDAIATVRGSVGIACDSRLRAVSPGEDVLKLIRKTASCRLWKPALLTGIVQRRD